MFPETMKELREQWAAIAEVMFGPLPEPTRWQRLQYKMTDAYWLLVRILARFLFLVVLIVLFIPFVLIESYKLTRNFIRPENALFSYTWENKQDG